MRLAIGNLTVYGAAHAIVDAACAALVLSHMAAGRSTGSDFAFLLVLYNALAFGLQPLIGFIADQCRLSYETAVAGCILTAAATLISPYPLLSVILIGIGNALFHVGGGIISLNLFKGKAAAPGIFVAPGALGLMIGTLTGKSGGFSPWPFILLLLLAAVAIMYVREPNIDYSTSSIEPQEPLHLILLLLLGSIAVRAIVGFVVNFPWKSNLPLLICLTMAVVLGKGLGGIAADRLGWRRVSVAGLLISAPLIAFGTHPIAGILGIFLFNLTMPVTLAAVSNLLPGFSGFAFGLTTLALVTGVFVTYLPFAVLFSNRFAVAAIILGSAAILNKALELYTPKASKTASKSIDIHL